MQSATPELVLASGSATRAAVLRGAGLCFRQVAAAIDEAAVKQLAHAAGRGAEATALELAGRKAASVGAPGAVVLGCDQLLVCEGAWFDKPPDLAAARRQLGQLRGRTHVLVTAVVAWRDGVEQWRHVARPELAMRGCTDAFLDGYVAMESEALLGSVGAYRIEGPGIQLFETVQGEFAAILGLPLLPLLAFLRGCGMLRD